MLGRWNPFGRFFVLGGYGQLLLGQVKESKSSKKKDREGERDLGNTHDCSCPNHKRNMMAYT